jgi:20S proteasome alpha/beta subunit
MGYEDILEGKQINKDYVIDIVSRFVDILLNNHMLEVCNGVYRDMQCNFIVASQDKMFVVYGDGAVTEHDTYAVIGCGDELVKGYLDTIDLKKNMTREQAEKLVETCIKKSCKDDIYIDNKIDLVCLEKEEI